KADFSDAWKRYPPPQPPPQEERAALDPGNLPFTRTSPCNDYTFREKTAVHQTPGEREEIEDSCNDTNAVDGCTGENPEISPSISSDSGPADDGRGIRCEHCNGNGELIEVAMHDCTAWLHRECAAPWMEANE